MDFVPIICIEQFPLNENWPVHTVDGEGVQCPVKKNRIISGCYYTSLLVKERKN